MGWANPDCLENLTRIINDSPIVQHLHGSRISVGKEKVSEWKLFLVSCKI